METFFTACLPSFECPCLNCLTHVVVYVVVLFCKLHFSQLLTLSLLPCVGSESSVTTDSDVALPSTTDPYTEPATEPLTVPLTLLPLIPVETTTQDAQGTTEDDTVEVSTTITPYPVTQTATWIPWWLVQTETPPWWVTQSGTTAAYEWLEPEAWSSDRLYTWGEEAGDTNLLDERDVWWEMYMCTNVKLNGRVGAPFFNNRYYSVHICDNGILQFNLEWRLFYPALFETDSWYDNIAVVSPFWAYSDEYVMENLRDEFPEAATKVYYHEYTASFESDVQTRTVLAKAKADVADSDSAVEEFEPTWVLVVTWVNIAPEDGCRQWPGDYDYYDYYDYGYSTTTDGASDYPDEVDPYCRKQAENAALNHFQAVIITDGTYTFVKFNYPEEGINWATPGITADDSSYEIELKLDGGYGWYPMAIGGFSSGDYNTGVNVTRNYVTGNNRIQMMDIDNVAGNYPDGRLGEWLFRIEESEGARTASADCEDWLRKQNIKMYSSYNQNSSCPQTITQVWWDPAFQFQSYQGDSVACYQNVFGSADGLKQRCCFSYDWDSDDFSSLLLGAPYGGHVVDTNNVTMELHGWQACCVEAIDMCGQFYKGRPFSDGENYVFPVLWPWFGDPHIITSDGMSYTFNGLGEYLFTQVGSGDTVIQARTERVVKSDGELGQATYFSAVCVASTGLPDLQIQINKGDLNATLVENQLQMIIDGDLTDIGLIEQDSNTTQEINGVSSNLLFKRTNASVTVLFSTGVSLTVSASNKMLTITLGLPPSMKGNTIGLTGVYDDDQDNDFTWPNATGYISVNSTESEVFEWASLFAISESDSIMYYTEANTDWWTYNNNTFTPVFTDDVDNWSWSSDAFKDSAYDTCGDDIACLYDVFVTGDLAVGESSKATAQESTETNAALSNFAPTISAPTSILITVGEEFTFSGSVNDSNGDVVTVTTNIAGASVSRSGNTFNITATVTNTTNFRMSTVAKDPAGAAASRTPLAMLCSCVNNGTCVALSTADQADIDATSVVLDCVCPTGYTGSLCETDLDACALVATPCYPGVLCQDQPAPAGLTGFDCGDCPAGYTGDGKTCSDIDECALDSCDHICVNSPGSFTCACRSGFELDSDGSTCADIDECSTLAPCHHTCTNNDGGYTCSCDSGFELNGDGLNCEPNNPCSQPSPCDDVNGYCNLVDQTEECSCKRGYTLNALNSSICEEVDECLLGIDACAQKCANTEGGYSCSCNPGYTISSNRLGCDDINECVSGTFDCHSSQICSNTPGNYTCSCTTGQTFKDGMCQTVSFTDPVETVTEDVETEVEQNAVQFTLQGMTVEEYTVEKEIMLFTELAEAATSICSDGSCNIVTLESEARRRRRRSTTVEFFKEYFARLPGYPMDDGSGGIDLAVYSKVPGAGVLESTKLLTALQSASTDIQTSLGVTLTNAEVVYVPTTTETMEESTTPDDGDIDTNVVIYAAVGGSLGAVLIVIIVAAVIVKMKTAQNTKTVYPTSDPDYSRRTSSQGGAEANMGGMAPVKMDPEMPPPSYEPPVPVEPTTMAYPAVRPMSSSKQTQEHSGRVATPPRDSYTPVDTDVLGPQQ